MCKKNVINEAIHIISDMIYKGTIEMLKIDHKDDEQAWLDNLDEVLSDEYIRVMRDHFEVDTDRIKEYVLWYIADRFDDKSLVDDLIEEGIARGERKLDDYLRQQE